MESIIRNVREITSAERRVYEAAFGHGLQENQQIIIQIINLGEPSTAKTPDKADESGRLRSPINLPEWCNVFSGLSDDEIAGVEQIVLQRSDMTRSS